MIPDSEERALSSYHISFPTGSPKASKTGIIVNVLYNPMSPVESFFSVAQSPSLAPSFRVSGNSRTWDLLVCTECIEHLKVGRLSPWWWSLSQSPERVSELLWPRLCHGPVGGGGGDVGKIISWTSRHRQKSGFWIGPRWLPHCLPLHSQYRDLGWYPDTFKTHD